MAALHVVAEGVVGGQRRSIAVNHVALQGRDKGADLWPSTDFAIPRSCQTEGTWLIKVTASTSWLTRSALVALDSPEVDLALGYAGSAGESAIAKASTR